MTEEQFALVGQAFDLLHTPYALELLATLCSDDQQCIDHGSLSEHRRAIEILRDLGALTTGVARRENIGSVLTPTTRGRDLCSAVIAINSGLTSCTAILTAA